MHQHLTSPIAANLEALTTTTLFARHRENFEDFLIVWLNENANETTKANQNTFNELRKHVNRIEIFDNSEECVDFVANIDNKKVLFIVSAFFGEQLVSVIYNFFQIDSIYIFEPDSEIDSQWTKEYKKVKAGYNEIESLCVQIVKDIKSLSNDSLTITSLNIGELQAGHQEPRFMHANILTEILINTEYPDSFRNNLVKYLEKIYDGNYNQLQTIEEFQRTYQAENAIWWYTRECFTYRVLNKALRDQNDVEMLWKMEFFLKDLHFQLENMHGKYVESLNRKNVKTLEVYRGYGHRKQDFNRQIKNNVGGFLSIASFLSTSADRLVALGYAQGQLDADEKEEVLLEIEVNIEKCQTAFADVQTESYMLEEYEVLFTMGAVFRIQSVQKDNQGIWIVQLKATGEEDETLKQLTTIMRDKVFIGTSAMNIACLLYHMGNYLKSEEIYLILLGHYTRAEYQEAVAFIHGNLGSIYTDTEQFEKAIRHHEKSLEIKLELLPEGHDELAKAYGNLGLAFHHQQYLQTALMYYNKALEIDLNASNQKVTSIANRYHNIGGIYAEQNRYEKALDMYQKSLKLYLIELPSDHPDLASTYSNIGQAYYGQGNFVKAIEYFYQTLEIYVSYLPARHPTIGVVYCNLSHCYYYQGNIKEAVRYAQMAYEISSETLPTTHSDNISNHEWITQIEREMKEQSDQEKFSITQCENTACRLCKRH